MKRPLPHETDQRYLVFAATGTDLIFNRGVDLPGFASFPLNEDPAAQPIIVDQMRDLIRVARACGLGCIIDTLTWMANRDRTTPAGYDERALAALNRTAVGLMRDPRDADGGEDALLALCLGPSRDPYADLPPMRVEEARDYHRAQIGAVSDMGLDLVNAYTFNQTAEAAGAILAARDCGLPISMSLVVETDGRLHGGRTLEDALAEIDGLTDGAAAYFMVNCAHPDHFAPALTGNPRLKGIVANASRLSHAELDDAGEVDEGDPDELGAQIAALFRAFPAIRVVGGCCGADMRHMRRIAEEVAA